MAQDFAAAFGVGEDEKYINMVDANGVTMVAIQVLYQMMQEKDEKISELQAEVAELKRQSPKRHQKRKKGSRVKARARV